MATAACLFASACMMVSAGSVFAQDRYVVGGGPAGGTFQIVANGLQTSDEIKKLPFTLKAQSSAGSVENLRKVNTGKSDFATVYSGHVYLGSEGKLKGDKRRYKNVMPIAYLYGAPAQLVVRKGSGIESAKNLVGKRVGVGNAGSGAYANAELFFTHLGIWDRIKRNAMGYNDASAAFSNNQLDAFWLFTAAPSGAVIQANQTNNIDLIHLHADAVRSGLYETYPYFTNLTIQGGTYSDVSNDIGTFQDSALLVANRDVPAEVVYQLLKALYSEKGLDHMVSMKKTFKAMSVRSGTNGIVNDLHPGAKKFWTEKGILK